MAGAAVWPTFEAPAAYWLTLIIEHLGAAFLIWCSLSGRPRGLALSN